MEAANGSINSKVIVQFSDPSNLFDDVAPLLQNRLPLGNLHWKSPSRPLRSIEELDISLDREQAATVESGAGRRHQIPGLRQTPFVKVLLLRCDDKERYRESIRKETKDWVKSLGFSTSGKATTKGQEAHDAFEYLILHVVVPGTTAATQPRSSKHISLEQSESTDSVNSKSKWTGKSTSTILDKLRADFASSSKASLDRVAQIRLSDPAKPSSALSALEVEEQWQDLVEKIKLAILQSFDARVAQYEEDIRDREGQRNLPGWNFCTFFILKEGLARGFENVGLLEDSLQIYEELDLGLDVVIQDQARADYDDAANALLPYAVDLKDTIRAVLEGQTTTNGVDHDRAIPSLQAWATLESKNFPWKLERRNYQEMILTNQVSALDFRIYIFIRQIQLMLRRAATSIPLPKSEVNRQSGPRWDADLLSDICERSIKFMNLAARSLRQDLLTAWGGQEGLPEAEKKIQKIAIDNIVASWKWSSLLQTLSDCQIITSFSHFHARSGGERPDGELFSPSDVTSSTVHGNHNNSVSTVSSNGASTSTSSSTVAMVKDLFSALRIVKGSKMTLLFWAGELFTMLRTIFIQLCTQSDLLPDVLQGTLAATRVLVVPSAAKTGILSPSLRASLQSKETATIAYRLLTMCACQCYTTAGKARISRQLLFDLANLEMYNDNYEATSSWLDAVPGFLESPPKTSVERSVLELYIKCLSRAGRYQDLVQSLLLDLQSLDRNSKSTTSVQQSWTQLLAAALQADNEVDLPFETMFDVEGIDEHITHDLGTDSCVISLSIRCLVPLEVLERVVVTLECQSTTSTGPHTLTFASHDDIPISACRATLKLRGNTILTGWYETTSLQISIGNVNFKHSLKGSVAKDDENERSSKPILGSTSIYIYQRNGAPSIEASHALRVDLSHKRNILLQITWGSNDISVAQLRLKPATAGLRLDLSAATSNETPCEVNRGEDAYVLTFNSIARGTSSDIEIPYAFDDVSTVSAAIRADLKYSTTTGDFELYENLVLLTLLPVGVNVQDIFQAQTTFSRFTLAPSRFVPVLISSCALQGSSEVSVKSPQSWSAPVIAFPKQPASWMVQIINADLMRKEKLRLDVSYQCMDEAIIETLLGDFSEALGSSAYNHASRPLRAHLRQMLPKLWMEQEIELAALTSEVELWTFEAVDWTTLLHAFSKSERVGLESWLRSWHDQRAIVPIRFGAAPMRQLRLLVDPPTTQAVVSTSLTLTSSGTCQVGQPVIAQLHAIVHMRTAIDAEFTVELTGQAETWLIGGQRRAAFASCRKEHSSTVILVAQKTGFLILPGIEVTCVDLASKQYIAIEVENLTVASTVEVRSNIKSTTIGLGDGESSEGHWLIDSQQRSVVP